MTACMTFLLKDSKCSLLGLPCILLQPLHCGGEELSSAQMGILKDF